MGAAKTFVSAVRKITKINIYAYIAIVIIAIAA